MVSVIYDKIMRKKWKPAYRRETEEQEVKLN